jgi:hypothetical protein
LDADSKATRQTIKGLLRSWIANGMFMVVSRKDDRHDTRPFLEVGQWATD